ncbi:MAG: hypothetical protein ACXACD_09610 [Candidatus Thorarchaeota archaeon]|jgi:hypothetical protein
MRKGAIVIMVMLLMLPAIPLPGGFVIQTGIEASEPIPPPEGIVSWWTGDGHPYDAVGKNHGELEFDTSFAPGLVDDAFSFDGYQDHVLAGGLGIDELQELTMELWVRHDSLSELATNRYITLGNEKAGLRHDRGGLQFYMNLGGLHHQFPNTIRSLATRLTPRSFHSCTYQVYRRGTG